MDDLVSPEEAAWNQLPEHLRRILFEGCVGLVSVTGGEDGAGEHLWKTLGAFAVALVPPSPPVYVVFSNIPGGPDEEVVFVEVETADGTGITLAKSADWHPHPVAPHLARLGPFYAHPEGT
jgi:hypothetical protein